MKLPEESVVHGSPAPASPPPAAQPQNLPALDRLLRLPACAALLDAHGHTLVANEARALLATLRAQALAGDLALGQIGADALAGALAERLQRRLQPAMRAVLNLTGTVIHTNLGRALLPQAALAHIQAMMASPNNLEYDLASGSRGDRDSIVEGLLCELTGAEAATVVNNNAAAVLLTLAALAPGKEVIVSRGELVEIGGAFRMPDVMASAGARLVEVGTTNRTHAQDYERAIGEHTALLMKVHTSNYAVQGFTSAVDEARLAPIAHARGLPLATDLGSGALIDMSAYGLPPEPTPQQMLAAGCDLVTFSGDKLLGGPQAGLIVGRKDLLTRIRKHPMKRALRMSKLPLAALEATLRLYLRPERLAQDLPTLRLLTRPLADITATAQAVLPALQAALAPRYQVQPVALQGQIGSGSLPVERLASSGLAIAPVDAKGVGRALAQLAEALRALPLPVIGRVQDDRLLLDMRCLEDAQVFIGQIGLLRLSDKR
ncbi:MAG: L-seryl-tRNA(Sec) selenium transferase [Alicycliphilus sp.]|jgi:L-seryl-tRNA(Ser) seleniumtransferase|uniref:L-seryl-tRNA(Sec) selenium transferase n=1 Tax=Diaphorobacter limosus TaxID=3036128 RepID=A0ABZ0J3B6_9BURK|nr:L-seryl-tRNA(Sec) selenium transferase [Diaphorobacter sp. Y-1]MBP6752018.1 L-seryl-tRNA(Sec) selenium transferase [Alicycliphilus sp.]MBP7325897.1 L-seryl-tRNA(Sec) selenium transferase [Alicycliphilus sp.]MBP7329080.1 L-seryl-tRNA(Sec) selenium transferase [Alicycliphilus sp.]MBP8137794.1 L-seryl-tRNA(Sec) selenium transferase [Alicycliphilus sp.]MBP8778789.1 L-seryl-tRNA(Sec) selenium transferase [Alicycliphilus sp.]